ncbi:MAG: HAD hydrolase family protein [Burkholderiales bacterium]|nr:HAD hydrolase family protein [Burkholderiales bacterium]
MPSIQAFPDIRLAAFDVDGVLTDGGLHYSGDGDVMKTFDVRDGVGMRMLQDSGIEVAIITSRKAPMVELRAADLGIRHLRQGVHDKAGALGALLAALAVPPAAAAFMGDDLVDLPAFRLCGFTATVAGAPALLKRHAHHVTRARGGHGAVREFCELLLHRRGMLTARTRRFLGATTD